jgi:hypothetical protein
LFQATYRRNDDTKARTDFRVEQVALLRRYQRCLTLGNPIRGHPAGNPPTEILADVPECGYKVPRRIGEQEENAELAERDTAGPEERSKLRKEKHKSKQEQRAGNDNSHLLIERRLVHLILPVRPDKGRWSKNANPDALEHSSRL